MIPKLFTNFRIWLLVAGLLSVTALGAYLKGRMDEKDVWIAKNAKKTIETVNQNIRVRNEQDNIIRPSDIELINSLHNGSF